jgi:hypothetical protein
MVQPYSISNSDYRGTIFEIEGDIEFESRRFYLPNFVITTSISTAPSTSKLHLLISILVVSGVESIRYWVFLIQKLLYSF